MAVSQMRADISRAGFYGSPDSNADVTCLPPATRVRAVELLDGDGTDQLPHPDADENDVQADTLRLVGNFATGDDYLITGVDAVGGTVFFQRSWQDFQRDFGALGTTGFAAAFSAAFRPGRILHITTRQGQHFFEGIKSVDTVNGTVTLDRNIGSGGLCVGGLADGASVAPLSWIEYRVIDPNKDAGGRFDGLLGADAALDEARGMTPALLVRQELDFRDGSVIPDSERVVLEYVAELDVMARVDGRLNATSPATLACQTANADPAARVRSLQVRLHTRSAGEDRAFNFDLARPDAPADPCEPRELLSYDVNPGVPGRARVRSAFFEVALPNLIARNL